jgi:hypothetical protein
MAVLELAPEQRGPLLYDALRSAFDAEKDSLAVERLEALVSIAEEVGHGHRREAGRIALHLGRLDLAAALLEHQSV